MTEALPHSRDAETAVLGSILIDSGSAAAIQTILQPEDFYDQRHNRIYEAMLTLHEDGVPIDLVTVCDQMQKECRLAEVGGPVYITSLINEVPTSTHAESYARIVQHTAIQRQLIAAGTKMVQVAYEDGKGAPEELLQSAQQLVGDVATRYQLTATSSSTWTDLDQVIGPIEWAWPSWLPLGFLTMIVGEQEAGKSVLALRIAACFLRGDPWPDGSEFTGKLGKIVWAEAEASQALNLERAKNWGLPTDNILHPLGDPLEDIQLNNHRHRAAVRALAHNPDVRMVVVDSLSGGHQEKENASNRMIPTVKWMAELSRDTGKYVILTHHLRKRGMFDTSDRVTLDRVRGSSGIPQTARMVWAIDAPDPNRPDDKRLSVIKSNLARKPEPLGFRICRHGPIFGDAPAPPRQETQEDRAADLLLALLAHGPVPSVDIQSEIEQAGLSWHAAKRVKEKLGIVSVKPGGIWHWSLPARDTPP